MTLATDRNHVTIRMYNVGFGDAFLIVFPGEDRPRRVLVDCGSHASGPGPRAMGEVVKQIIADVTDANGTARIDVVVATHRHRDHVSGFADPQWSRVEVSEIWMPWTENPRDAEATRIRDCQSRLAAALSAPGFDATTLALANNALSNESAMKALHRGFAGSPARRFLASGDAVASPVDSTTLAEAGIAVDVLGPSRDEAVIRDMDPPKGASYLRLTAEDGDTESGSPFAHSWTIESRELDTLCLGHMRLSSKQRSLVERAAEEDPLGVAVALEKAVNGTSLVLAFRQRDACLLFAGDAQWGTWKRILDAPAACALLRSTSFLKIGHHGSHNATPRDVVKELAASHDADTDPLWAMVSTRPIAMWKQIPKKELLTALRKVTPQLARSDAGKRKASPGFAEWTTDHIDARVPI